MNRNIIVLLAVILTLGAFSSCKEYYDELQGIGKRVEVLEDSALVDLNKDLLVLQNLVQVVEGLDFVSSLEKNEDGTYSISFASNPDKVYTLANGRDGDKGEAGSSVEVGVVQDPTTGVWYWTINGKQTTMPVEAKDGTDGKNGQDASAADVVVPLFTIDNDGNWLYSLDNGKTWNIYLDDNGDPVSANGKDGNPDKVFSSVSLSEDGSTATFVLHNGTVITVKLK